MKTARAIRGERGVASHGESPFGPFDSAVRERVRGRPGRARDTGSAE